jgi:hypothetical protein
MTVRHDGSRYPDSAVDDAALEDFSDLDPSNMYEYSLGDLIVQALVGRDLIEDCKEAPQEWESFEHAILAQTALELRALNVAFAAGDCLTTDNGTSEEFTAEMGMKLLRALTARVEAGAELARRLRRARWGHPSFGGGESWKDAAAPASVRKSEAAE